MRSVRFCRNLIHEHEEVGNGHVAMTATKGMKLDTAVILTNSGLFGCRDEAHETGTGPLIRVGGISLFMRALLTLQRAQFTNVLVLAGEELSAVRGSLREDSRLTLNLRWLPVREFPPDDPRTWQAVGSDVQGACLVLGARAMFSRELLMRLREEASDGQIALVLGRSGGPERLPGDSAPFRINPLAEYRGNRLLALHDGTGETRRPENDAQWRMATDMAVLPSHLLAAAGSPASVRKRVRVSGAGARASGRATSPDVTEPSTGRLLQPVSTAVYPIRALLDRAAVDGVVRVLPTSPGTPHWYHDVHHSSDHKAAEDTLLRSLKGDLEGYVDRHFNRRISRVFTRFFLKLGVSANAITMISMGIGLLAAAFVAKGGYAAGVLGALLLQLSAIVDCCDGEVARLTFTESSFGEHLDLLADNIVHTGIFAGMAWSVAQGSGPLASVALALGAVTIVANGLSFSLVLRVRHLRKTGGWTSVSQSARSNFILQHIASRDFSVLILVFALLNHLDWFLLLSAIGSNVFWIVTAWLTRPSLKSSA